MKKIIIVFIGLFLIAITSKLNQTICQDISFLPVPYKLPLLKGGLNLDTATNLLDPSESPNLLNCDLDETDALNIRKGFTLAYTLPVNTNVKLLSSFVATYDDGTSEFFVQAGSDIYKTTGEDVWTKINTTGLSTQYPTSFELFKNRVFMTNGVDDVAVWDKFAQTYTKYSFIPKGRYLVNDKSQLLISGVLTDPSNVYFSVIENEGINSSDWRSDYYLRCGFGDGQTITGMFAHDGRIYVLKENSVYGLLTSANYTDAEIIKYSDLYGCVSNASVNNWQSAKILLNKYGLYAYDGGRNWEFIGKNLRSLTDKIGLLSGQSSRWTTTSNNEFAQGDFSNCWNNNGTIQISTYTKKWDTTADFEGAGYSVYRSTSANDKIEISLVSGVGYTKYPLKYHSQSSLMTFSLGNLVYYTASRTGSFIGTCDPSGSAIVDGNESTFSSPVIWKKNYEVGPVLSHTSEETAMTIKKIRLKMRNGIFDSYWNENVVGSYYWISANMNRYGLRLSNSAWDSATYKDITFPNYSYSSSEVQNLEYIIPTPRTDTTRIWLAWTSNIEEQRTSDGAFGTCYLAPVFFELEAYSYTPSVFYSSGNYTSPNFTSAGANGQYKYLRVSDTLSHTANTSSDTIKYYASNNGTSWTYLGLSSGSYTTFQLPNNLDNNTNFYWKSELTTSSTTATPSVSSIELEYSTTDYAIYTDKVFDVGSSITKWGSFIGDDEGTVRYQIRAATYSFTETDGTLLGNATQWYYITSGEDITLPITHRYIQRRAFLESKDAYLNGMTLTWFTGEGIGGGMQDTPSINWADKYYIAYSTYADYNTHTLIFNKEGRWTRYDWQAAGFANFNNNFYILSSTQPIIFKAFTGTSDSGAPINFIYETGDLDFGDSDRKKELIYTYITGKKQSGSGCNFQVYLDYSTTPTTLGQSDNYYADFSADSNYRIIGSSQSYSKNMRIKLSTSTVGNLEIQRIVPYLIPKDLQ